ncbi:MAG TPA: IclR family transcriptional regulator, partial [Solirubrobacteraceae bacterium]|nr:IclR family transcriptional regulator [Solirubrobacteraceae bacterium]
LPTSHEGRYSQSLERGLAILRAFTPDRPWMGIAELAKELEMSRPTTHRYASTLVALDYLEQGPRRKYRLGMRASDPGRSALNSTALGRLPHTYLADLRDRSECTAGLAVLDGREIVYIDRAKSSRQGQSEVSARLGRGSRLPASSTAVGRALLAHLPPQEQSKALGAPTDNPDSRRASTARKKLMRELDQIRERGFAIADQLHLEGQRSVAAPVRSSSASTKVVAAVEITVARADATEEQTIERLLPMLLASAEEISAHLDQRPQKRPKR